MENGTLASIKPCGQTKGIKSEKMAKYSVGKCALIKHPKETTIIIKYAPIITYNFLENFQLLPSILD